MVSIIVDVKCYCCCKGVDKGGAREAKAPPDFLANIILWGHGHAKVDVVVQKFHVRGL